MKRIFFFLFFLMISCLYIKGNDLNIPIVNDFCLNGNNAVDFSTNKKPNVVLQRTRSWDIATKDTKLTVGITRTGQLCIYKLKYSMSDWNWTISPSIIPFIDKVRINGKTCNVLWKIKNFSIDNSEGKKLTIRFVSKQPAMELISVWKGSQGHGPVHYAMYIRNNTKEQITIPEQETFDLHITGSENTSAYYINDDGSAVDTIGVYHDLLTPGYKKTLKISEKQDYIPFIAINNNKADGIYIGWEWSIGRINIEKNALLSQVHLQVGNRDDFRTDLMPGEKFEVPPGFIGAYKGDLDDAGNSLRPYLFNYSMPASLKKKEFPKVEWNAFAATGKKQGGWDCDGHKYYPFIDDIAPLGFEEVVIDIGWWSSYGNPTPGHIVTDSIDWPKGMADAADYAHQHNISFGLYDNQPEDLNIEKGINKRFRDITYLIKNLKADFYRSDATAGPVLTGDYGPNHHAHYKEDKDYWTVKGFYLVIDSLYKTIPGFLWENCSGGGRLKDYGTNKRAAKIQNQDSYYPLDARRSFYDTSFVMLPMQIAALDGSWSKWQATGSVYEFRSASMGAAYWHPDAPNGGNGGPIWTAQQKEDIAKAVKTYKEKLRPLIRHANIYHVFPRPDGKHWDGIEYYNPNAGKGVVYLFKPSEDVDSMKMKLRGIDEKAVYRITFEDKTNKEMRMVGAKLSSGIEVMLKGKLVSELMFFEIVR